MTILTCQPLCFSRRLYWVMLLIIPLFIALGCKQAPKFKSKWTRDFSRLGSSSSVRCADLNGDGVLDIVVGASENEFVPSDSSVLALDGKTGSILWSVFAKDQIVGTATFLDITHDGAPEVFIGGRASELICINGATGQELWRFQKDSASYITRCCLRYNFYNPQLIPDQDGDGLQDLLVSNGGNVAAEPFSEKDRHPGVLAIFSSKTGVLLAADTMPDGKETYMSPVIHDFDGKGQPSIVFGTGGETLGGGLYRVDLTALLQGNISAAVKLASEQGRGFIAPPTLADVNEDGVKDIIVNWFGGKMMAFDGKEHHLLWETPVPNTEVYSSAVPGFFNSDPIPDFFSMYNKGMWPDNKGSVQLMIDGKTGAVLYSDSLGCMGYSSGVTADLNGDGFDEAIWSINEYVCNPPSFVVSDLTNDKHSLIYYDFHNQKKGTLVQPTKAKNISTTPWIGDLDGDSYLDLVYCIQRNTENVVDYRGIRIERISTNIKATREPSWGAYMGANGSGIFEISR